MVRVHDAAILVHLQNASERLLQRPRVEVVAVQAHQRHRPVEALGDAGRLLQRQAAKHLHEPRDLLRETLRQAGHARVQNLDLLVERRIREPEEQAPASQRVGQFPRAVAREDHVGLVARADRAELGDRDLPFRQHLEQERLECLVGAIHFVDEQHGRPIPRDRLEQRPLEQERLAEHLALHARRGWNRPVSLKRAWSIWRG